MKYVLLLFAILTVATPSHAKCKLSVKAVTMHNGEKRDEFRLSKNGKSLVTYLRQYLYENARHDGNVLIATQPAYEYTYTTDPTIYVVRVDFKNMEPVAASIVKGNRDTGVELASISCDPL